MLADFHIHSTFSDGRMTIPEIVDFFGKRGFGAIAVTDHLCEEETLWGHGARVLQRTLTRATWPLYIEILKSEAERARRQYGMVLIPGVEMTKNSLLNSKSAHVLALGVSDYLPADLPLEQMLPLLRGQGAVTIAAHPVSTRKVEKQTRHLWDNRQELAPLFDAWEVASGPYLFTEVADAGLPVVASSDLHHPRQITSWKTIIQGPAHRHPEAVLDAIRTQNLDFRFYEDPYGSDLPVRLMPGPLAHSAGA